MENVKNTPALRFSEFRGEWEMKYGNSVFETISNKNHNSDLPILAISQEYGAVPREMINYQISVTDRSVESYKIIEIGDFIISLRSFQGGIEYSNYLGICSPAYIILRPTIEISNIFFKYFFKTDYYIGLLCKKLEGIRDGKMISYKYFSEILLPFPALPEQKKISTFLTKVDEKLQALKQKKNLLEQYKKGVMQQLFSQELRFTNDNGDDFADWEEKKLGEIAVSHYQGINTAADNTSYYASGFPILQAKHITSEKITYYDAKYVCPEDFKKYEEKYNPKIDEILITNIGTIGKIVLIEDDVKFLIAWNIFKVKLKENLSDPKYITYVLKFVASKGYFEEVQSGNATKFVNKTEMLAIPILLPSLPEQTKIANFLSAIDNKINHCQSQIVNTEVWKKGLLQKMFA